MHFGAFLIFEGNLSINLLNFDLENIYQKQARLSEIKRTIQFSDLRIK